MSRTHYTPRGSRRAAAVAAALSPLQWHQLERLTDSGAWTRGTATVPATSRNAAALIVPGLQLLVARGLAEGDGHQARDRWRIADAGHQLVMATR